MNVSGDIRVKTDQRYKNLYVELKNFAVGDMHELFFMRVSWPTKQKEKSFGSGGDERFWSRTITPDEYTCFCAMLLNDNEMDLSVIKDDKHVIAEVEKYANAGMEILIEEFLGDYFVKGNSDLKLDSTSSKELPKALLYFIYEKLQ